MVDRSVLAAKCDAIAHHVDRLRARRPLSAAALDQDEDLRNVILMDLQQAIQSAIDLATHVCSHEGLGLPQGPAAAFARLASSGILQAEVAVRLAGAAGLRNIIVHRYGDLSMREIVRVIENGLVDLETFAAAIRAHARA